MRGDRFAGVPEQDRLAAEVGLEGDEHDGPDRRPEQRATVAVVDEGDDGLGEDEQAEHARRPSGGATRSRPSSRRATGGPGRSRTASRDSRARSRSPARRPRGSPAGGSRRRSSRRASGSGSPAHSSRQRRAGTGAKRRGRAGRGYDARVHPRRLVRFLVALGSVALVAGACTSSGAGTEPPHGRPPRRAWSAAARRSSPRSSRRRRSSGRTGSCSGSSTRPGRRRSPSPTLAVQVGFTPAPAGSPEPGASADRGQLVGADPGRSRRRSSGRSRTSAAST